MRMSCDNDPAFLEEVKRRLLEAYEDYYHFEILDYYLLAAVSEHKNGDSDILCVVDFFTYMRINDAITELIEVQVGTTCFSSSGEVANFELYTSFFDPDHRIPGVALMRKAVKEKLGFDVFKARANTE